MRDHRGSAPADATDGAGAVDAADRLWVPDSADGSGWAPVDWTSVASGSRYHYRHGAPLGEAMASRVPFYRVVTRLESETLRPHENSYFVPADVLADFVGELSLAAGAEIIWHIEPVSNLPAECGLMPPETGTDQAQSSSVALAPSRSQR